MERLIGPLPEDVLAGLQVESRHWLVDPATGEHRESNSDMAAKAAKQALDLAGIEVEQVELLTLCTSSPDYMLPAMVTFVQEKLGLQKCAVVEIRSGADGPMEALDVARLSLEQGSSQTAVVIGSEAISPLLVPLFLGKEPDSLRMRDRLPIYNHGDGAGAIVLQASDEADGILGSAMACIGGGKKPGMQIVGGGTHAPLHKQLAAPRFIELKVDVVEAGRFTPTVLVEALADTLRHCGVSADSIDLCVIPEGNAGYVLAELRAAGLPTDDFLALQGKIFDNLSLVSATGSAALPLALDHAWKTGAVKPGDRVMLVAIEVSKWIYAGNVLTWTARTCPAQADASTGTPAGLP
ncbi:MAG: 3-oxoacyl-ACP synthase III family protein [Dehalococcoidia bacterium]